MSTRLCPVIVTAPNIELAVRKLAICALVLIQVTDVLPSQQAVLEAILEAILYNN
jgi:hypothetical protein